MTVDTTTLVRQMLEALRQIDAALDPDDWAGDVLIRAAAPKEQ